ncbi:holin, partial [Salmonella enterica]
MQEYEKGFIALAVMGAMIALGKLLNSDEPITLRLVTGRVIVGSGLSLIAGVA